MSLRIIILLLPEYANGDTDAEFFKHRLSPFINSFCADCHKSEDPVSRSSFMDVSGLGQISENRGVWRNVMLQLRNNTMPPSGELQPSHKDKVEVADWLESYLRRTALDLPPYAGHVVPRRLSRSEYNNTIIDVFGVDLGFNESFALEGAIGEGFDNNGESLFLTPNLLGDYLAAAQQVVDAVVISPTLSASASGNSLSVLIYVEREYDIAVTVLPHAKPTTFDVIVDGTKFETITLKPAERSVSIPVQMTRGNHQIEASGADCLAIAIQERPRRLSELDLAVHESLLGIPPGAIPEQPLQHMRNRLEDILPKAFRRPVTVAEVDRYMTLYHRSERRGDPFEERFKLVMKAVLVSVNFLFRIEGECAEGIHPVNDHELAVRLSYFLWNRPPDAELMRLANDGTLSRDDVLDRQVDRLLNDNSSYNFSRSFMGQWLGTDELGRRISPVVLYEPYVNPCWVVLTFSIATVLTVAIGCYFFLPRPVFLLSANLLVCLSFAMVLAILSVFPPAPPEYTLEVVTDMREEGGMLLHHMIVEDRSILDLVHSDYVVLNARLARYYDLDVRSQLHGDGFQRIVVGDHGRGGLLGMGSVQSLASGPVQRGAWVLERLLGTPLPPPPPNVPPLNESATLFLSERETLERHRASEACMGCHRVIDPIGFGLENFDAHGRWRSVHKGQFLDATGAFPTGETFSGPSELKQILAQTKKVEFLRQISKKLLAYAIGRNLLTQDDGTIERLVADLAKNQYSTRRLIHEIVKSTPFRYKQQTLIGEDL